MPKKAAPAAEGAPEEKYNPDTALAGDTQAANAGATLVQKNAPELSLLGGEKEQDASVKVAVRVRPFNATYVLSFFSLSLSLSLSLSISLFRTYHPRLVSFCF